MSNQMIKLALLPNSPQKKKFAQCAGAYRWIYNKALEERKLTWKTEKRHLTFYDQVQRLSFLKEQKDMEWLNEMSSQMLKQALFELDKNCADCHQTQISNASLDYPHFRVKGKSESFCYPMHLTIDKKRVNLPKIGWVYFSGAQETEALFKNTTVILEDKNWYAYDFQLITP